MALLFTTSNLVIPTDLFFLPKIVYIIIMPKSSIGTTPNPRPIPSMNARFEALASSAWGAMQSDVLTSAMAHLSELLMLLVQVVPPEQRRLPLQLQKPFSPRPSRWKRHSVSF